MEGRTGLPVSVAPPYPAPTPPPHGTVPAPAAVASDTVLSPVFADLPAGPNASTRASTASSVSSPGHASYQGKLFPSSVAALAGASGFSHLSNFISSASSDSFKQAASMNQYWLPNSEGYSGFPVGGTHPYQSYFASLNSLQGIGPQGLLAVSTTAKTEGQRIPASHHTRSIDPWEGPPSKVPKFSSHSLKDSALSPRVSGHKSRHVSGSEDTKVPRHDLGRSKAKEKLADAAVIDEKKDSGSSRSNRSNIKGGTSPFGPKQELKLDGEVSQDLQKADRLPDSKQSAPNNPGTLTVDVNNSLEEPSSLVLMCNGDSIQSPKKNGLKTSTNLSAVSPKSKELGMEKRKKTGKRKDLSVDVNGNAVLPSVSAVDDKKPTPQTSTVVCESKKVLDMKETENLSAHASTEPEASEKLHPVLTDSSTNGIHRTSLTADAVPLVSNMVPSEKLSPASAPCKVTHQASPPLLSIAVRSPPQGTSSTTTSPPGLHTCEAISVQTTFCGAIVSTSVEGSSSPEDNPTSGSSVKSNSLPDNPKQPSSLDVSSATACNSTTSCPVGNTASSLTNTHGTDSDPSRISSVGLKSAVPNLSVINPKETNLKGTYLAGLNPPRENLSQSSPTSSVRTTEAYLAGANPLPAIPPCTNPTRLSPTGSKISRTSPVNKASLCSPQSTLSGDSTGDSPVEKEKMASPRCQASTTFSTCVTSSVSKPISFPAHGPLASPSSQSQPPYISHLPIYLHGTGHLSLEREVGRETPRDGSKVHATTFVPALGEFIPGPASSATIPVKESKTKTSSSGKDNTHGLVVSEKEKDKSTKKDVNKTRDLVVSPPKSELANDKAKLGASPQLEAGIKSKDITESKLTLAKGKSEKADKHEKSKRSHSSSKPSHEGRDHHLSPSEFSGKDRGAENALRTGVDSIHRETCRMSDAAIISTTPSVHSYAHHMASFPVALGSMASSSRDGSKLDVPSSIYSSEEQRRYLEWHMAASKRGYCYDHPSIRLPGQEPPKLDSTIMQRTLHQRTESRPELIPEHSRGRDFPSYTSPQDSMLRSVLTAGMHQAHSETQHASPGNGSKSNKPSCDSKTENRGKSTSHGSIKVPSEGLGSQGRLTPGTKGSDGRNPPVGIAVAQKRQDSESVTHGRPSTIATSRNLFYPSDNSPHIGSEETEDRGGRPRLGADRDTKHRDHSPRSHREAGDLLPPTKYHHHRFSGDLGSNLIVTGGTGLGPSPHHFDPTEGRMTPSHLTLPPPWLPRAPGPPHASSLWLGHPFSLATAPASSLHAGEGTPSHLQIPPAGFQIARDPTTGQVVLVPQAPAVHSDSGVPPNLSMWPPYLVPPHLQPHSHQLQQLVLNQPSFGPPVPHQAPHPLTHRPDQQLPSTDYHFALQQHQEAIAQWYRQDEQRQREEQRRREQQSRKSNGEKSSEKSHKGSSGGDSKSESHAEKQSVTHDVLNLKIPPHASYLPGVPLPGQPPVPYVYPPQQVQYLYSHTGVFPTPGVSCNSSPRTESGASTASPKQTTTKSGAGSGRTQMSKSDSILKTALKSISVQTSPSETPASVDFAEETKLSNQDDEQSSSVKTDESEDQELIIVDVVNDDINDNPTLQSISFTQDNKDQTQTNTHTEPSQLDVKSVDDLRTSNLSSASNATTDDPSEVNSDPALVEKTVTETMLPMPPLNMPPTDTQQPSQETPVSILEEPGKESLMSNFLTTTQSFASRMEALDQDQLAAIEGIALLSEVADQKAFAVCSESDKAGTGQSSQTRDDSYLLDNRHQDNGTPLQGNTASAVTSASGSLPLITQSCPTSPTDFIFKRSASSEGVENFNSPGDLMNPNEVEMRQRLAELQRKYQEKKRELDKLQRKKDKNPMIKSSTAVLLEAAASLEENSPFVAPKKKKKRDREDKEKGRTDEKKKSSKKDKESSKSKKRKHKMKEEMQESSLSSEEISSTSGIKIKSKSKTKSKTSSPKDIKQKATSKSRKVSPTDSANSDSLTKPSKSPKNGGALRSPRSHNSSTDFDTDSGSIIWPSTSTSFPSVTPKTSSFPSSSKSKSKSSKKKIKDSKAGKNGKKGASVVDSPADSTMEATEYVIRKTPGSQDHKDRGNRTPQHLLHMYEDDSDSPWETAMIDGKQKRNLAGQSQQKGLALLAGISSQELMKNTSPGKAASSKDSSDAKSDTDPSKRKSGKAKKRSLSPASSEQEPPKKSKRMSPGAVKKEKEFECPSKLLKSPTKQVKKKEKTQNETKSTPIKQEEKPFFNEEIWTRRRSERIFLSDISPGTSRDVSPHTKGLDSTKATKKPNQTLRTKAQSESSSAGEQGPNTDHNSVANIGSVLDALKTDTLQIRKKLASMSAQEDEQDDAPRKTKKKLSKRRDQAKKVDSKQEHRSDCKRSKEEIEMQDSSCSEAENLPLSNLVDRQTPPAPRSCLIDKEELQNGLRVLTLIDGLFYAGYVSAIQPPDVYGVILDGERGNRPHVFSQEQILQETFVDVKPLSTRYVPEGTRVCAYWSQQFRCLYPGTVVKGTPNPNEDPNFVCVEFDDGDSGRIPVDHIRMLPHDYPIVEFEPIPTELQRRRRRRTSDTSSTANYKQEGISEDTGTSKAKNSSAKKKPKLTDPSKSSLNQPEMDKILESGEDDVFLPHSPKVLSKSKKSKSHDKSKKSSTKSDSKIKEKRKKKKRKREERRQELADRKRSKRSSSKSPRGSPARSPSRSPNKSKKKKRKEDRKKKNSAKLNSTNTDSSPPSSLKTKSAKKKSSSSLSIKRKSHRDEKHSSFCTVETETVYSTHPISGSRVLTEEETASETPGFDGGKGAWSKHRDTRDHSLDDWSSSDSSKDSSSDSDETTSESMSSKDNIPLPPSHKRRSSCLPSTSKMTAFLPARQLWNWFGKATQRRGAKGKARKVFYRAIMRENEIIRQGDAAVFLSTGRPHLPYIGRIESMWESWGGNMVVRVKWFYHPEETKGGRKSHDGKMALYQSLHVDENDVQTISHKCEVLSVDEYKRYTSGKKHKYTSDSEDIYYLAGTYDPTSGHITSVT